MRSIATEQFAAISRLFSSSVIHEMARKGKSPLFARLARESGLPGLLLQSDAVHSFFELAFSFLKQEGFRHEYIYKAALTHKVLLGKHSLQTAAMLTEFRVGECKADLAILNGTATVYEIKSERDSLVRLDRQVRAYAGVFARVYVIAADAHVDAVLRTVSDEVGVLCLNRRHNISTVREAADQPERTSPSVIFDSIRTQEARMILEAQGISLPSVPNTEVSRMLRDFFVQLEPVAAHVGMVRVLKKTRNLLPLSNLIAQLPPSLHTAALAVPLRKTDHARLVSAVNTPLQDAMRWV